MRGCFVNESDFGRFTTTYTPRHAAAGRSGLIVLPHAKFSLSFDHSSLGNRCKSWQTNFDPNCDLWMSIIQKFDNFKGAVILRSTIWNGYDKINGGKRFC